jgi:hypothetical protein
MVELWLRDRGIRSSKSGRKMIVPFKNLCCKLLFFLLKQVHEKTPNTEINKNKITLYSD